MVKLIRLIVVLLLLAGAAWAVYWYAVRQPTDPELLELRLREMTRDLTKAPKEHIAMGLLKAEQFPNFFTDPFEFNWSNQMLSGSFNAAEITANFQRLRTAVESAEFSISDLKIEIISSEYATVRFTGAVDATTKGAERWIEARDIQSDWLKVNGVWRMSRLNAVDILRH